MGLIRRVQAWRRYRYMSRRLAELDRLDKQPAWELPEPPRRPLGGRGKLALALLAAFVAVIALADRFVPRSGPLDELLPTRMFQSTHSSPATKGSHAFLALKPDGKPVTYDSCKPIRYVVNPAGMPPDGDKYISQAIQVVSSASGLTFSYVGQTDERPAPQRPSRQPQRYGKDWAPVLIAWVDQAELEANVPPGEAMPNADVEGQGGSTSVTPGGPELTRFVTGQVMLARQAIARNLAHGNGPAITRAVIVHELGHVLGLAHVSNPREIMSPVNTGQTELGPGDREGFALAGSGPCWR